MKPRDWEDLISASADPQRCKHYIKLFLESEAREPLNKFTPQQVELFVTLLSGSEALAELLLKHPQWLDLFQDEESTRRPRAEQGLRRQLNLATEPLLKHKDYSGALRETRLFKEREMLRVAIRDLGGIAGVIELTREISAIADVCLSSVYLTCHTQLTERFGQPYHIDYDGKWQTTPFTILGMGKLGGQELNYSSDVDLLFVYADEGNVFKTPPSRKDKSGKGLSNHQFFNRLSEAIIAETSKITSDGMLYRVDMRLRPEGDSGPLSRSLASYENYYSQWGQTWERMMLIKARGVAGDISLAGEFLEMVQPFRYTRNAPARVLHDVTAVKERIEKEVVGTGELDRNIKLGRGGIREVEFIVQTYQILHGGHQPFLHDTQTLPTLKKLERYKLLPFNEVELLAEAYCFFRNVEHRLQMDKNQQTHLLPTERKARERIARLMGFDSLAAFEKKLKQLTTEVRAIYDKHLLTRQEERHDAFPEHVEGYEDEWRSILSKYSFREPDKAFNLIKIFVEGPGFVHVSSRTTELALSLLPRFLSFCPQPDKKQDPKKILSDPDRVLARIDSFITAYGTRALLYETWTNNPQLFELMLFLFDRSEFLAEMAIRVPDMVDELALTGHLRRQKSAEEILKDLRHGIKDEDQKLWITRYHQTEFMRLGLRDILGVVDFESNLVELSALADACLQYALEVVTRQNKLKSPPFAIIGMGKLGGNEITYGSDLDVVYVAPNGVKNLPALQKVAVQVAELLSGLFIIDARLRPDGEKGLLVNTLDSYEDYYRHRGVLWEIQSLSRARFVAGNEKVGTAFITLTRELANFSTPPKNLSTYAPDWKKTMNHMRMRIEKERTPAGQNELAIKTGTGGLMDAEFLAQAFCLETGTYEPNTLSALQKAQAANYSKSLPQLIDNYKKLRLVEGILRRWSYEGETVLPTDSAPFLRVAIRCGFLTAADFSLHLANARKKIREAYQEVFT